MNIEERLSEIEAYCSAATPGPWDASHVDTNHREVTSRLSEPFWIIKCETQADTDFIAYARTDVPALVKALREAVDCMNALKSYHETMFVEGEAGYQVAIECGHAFKKIAAILTSETNGERK